MDIQQLQEENQRLHKTLNTAIHEAKLNEDVLKRFSEIEIRMLSCAKLTDLLCLLVQDFKTMFKLDVVTVFLHNKDELVAPLLVNLDQNIVRNIKVMPNQNALTDLFIEKRCIAGEIERSLRKQFFPDSPFILSSVLLPLINKGQIIGSLNLGSLELNRYHSEYRYNYLERMSALLAVCIENCIIRENLDYLSSTDTLTKINNRRSFDLEIDQGIRRSIRQQQALSLLFLDIDHFKQVNDNYGHCAGDLILKTFAQLLKGQIRSTDFIARYGGEEFAILLPNCNIQQAGRIAGNICLAIEDYAFDINEKRSLNITTSIGVSCYADKLTHSSNIKSLNISNITRTLLKKADDALYEAKNTGRNKVVLHSLATI